MKLFRVFVLFSLLFSMQASVYGSADYIGGFEPDTPGKTMSRQQSEVLTRQNFDDTLGSEVIDKWGIDWDIFSDIKKSPFDSVKRNNMSRLIRILKRYDRRDSLVSDLYSDVLLLKARLEAVHEERLEKVTKDYFSNHFEGSRVTFDTKTNGVQLGVIANIILEGKKVHRFYVKTHSEGKLVSKSSAPKPVNPRELLIYKILENLGFGCETHFFARSPEDVYIATLDAREGGEFFLFEEAVKDEENLGKSLWGFLGTIDTTLENDDLQEIEAQLEEDPAAQNFVEQFSALDALSRILRLHDCLNNPENFGFYRDENSPLNRARVIDFRIPNEIDTPIVFDHFYGFIKGNGLFNYSASHKTLCYALRQRPTEHRVNTTLRILTEGSLSRLAETIEESFGSVLEYLQGDIFSENRDALVTDVSTCQDALINNYVFFIESLQNWHPEEEGP